MALVNLSISKDYGYVLAAVSSTFFISTWQGFRTANSRKPAGIAYPNAYATSADIAGAKDPDVAKAMYVFNCAQRAHANFLESQPSVMAATLIAGLSYPLISASVGGFWALARVVYAVGYTRPDKDRGQGRIFGFMLSFFSSHALYALAAWTGARMILYS